MKNTEKNLGLGVLWNSETIFNSVVLSVGPRPSATALPGIQLKIRFSSPTADLLNQKLEWGPAICVFPAPPGGLMHPEIENHCSGRI